MKTIRLAIFAVFAAAASVSLGADLVYRQIADGNTTYNRDGRMWYSADAKYVPVYEEDGITVKYYVLDQGPVNRSPTIEDNVTISGYAEGDKYVNGNAGWIQAYEEKSWQTGDGSHPMYWIKGTTDDMVTTGYKDAEKTVVSKTNYVERILSSLHNGGTNVYANNLTINFAKEFLFGNSSNPNQTFTFHFIDKTSSQNTMNVADTMTVGGGKNIIFYTDKGLVADYINLGRLNVAFDSSSTLKFGNGQGTISELRIGVDKSESGDYALNSLAASTVAANSALQIDSEVQNAYIGNIDIAKGGNLIINNVASASLMGDINNRGTLSFKGTTSASAVSGKTITQTFADGEETVEGVTNINDSAVVTDTTIVGGTTHFSGGRFVNSTQKGGLINMSGTAVSENASFTDGALLKYYGGTLSGTTTFKDGQFATSNESTAFTLAADAVINAETNKFHINYTNPAKGKVDGGTSADVNISGVINFKGNGKYSGGIPDTKYGDYFFQLNGKDVYVNELNIAGGMGEAGSSYTANLDWGHARIKAGNKLDINKLTLSGDTALGTQYLYIRNASTAATATTHFGTFALKGGETTDAATYGVQTRVNTAKTTANVATIDNLQFTGAFKSGQKIFFGTHYTHSILVKNMVIDTTAFSIDHEYNFTVAGYYGTDYRVDNLDINYAYKNDIRGSFLAKNLDFGTANITSTAGSIETAFNSFEKTTFEELTIGADSAANSVWVTVNGSTYTANKDGTNTGDDRDYISIGKANLNANGVLQLRGVARSTDYNVNIGELNMNDGRLKLGYSYTGTAEARAAYKAVVGTLNGTGNIYGNEMGGYVDYTLQLGNNVGSLSAYAGSIYANNANSTISIVKTGANAQVLSGTNNNLNGGSVAVNGGALLLASANVGDVSIATGAAFGAAGALNVNSLTKADGAYLAFDFSQSDYTINIKNDLIGNVLGSDFLFSSFDMQELDVEMTLISFADAANINESLKSLNGKTFEYVDAKTAAKYNGTFSIDGSNFNVTFEVPEPATWAAIFGALALAFAIYRRRK